MSSLSAVAEDTLIVWMQRIQQGEHHLWQVFLQAIEKRIRARLRALQGRQPLPNDADLNDIYQDFAARLMERARQYDPQRPLWPWLFRVAANLFFDQWRRLERRKETEWTEQPDMMESQPPKVGERIDIERAFVRLHEHLLELPLRERSLYATVLSHMLQGDSLRELALNHPDWNMSRVYRAKYALVQLISEYTEAHPHEA